MILPEDFAFVPAFIYFDRSGKRTAITEEIAIAKLETDDTANVGAIAERDTKLFGLRFLGSNIEPKQIAIDRDRFDLQKIKQAAAHESAEFFVHRLRGIGFPGEAAEPS